MLTIGKIAYVVEDRMETESIKDSHPHAYGFQNGEQIVATLQLRRPKGRRRYLAYEYADGQHRVITSI